MNRPDFPDDTDIIIKNGYPFIPKGKSYVINPGFWAAKFLKENDVEHYDVEDGDGWHSWNGTRWISISKKTILDNIEQMLLDGMASQDIPLQHEVDRVQQRIYQIIQKKQEKGRIPPIDPDIKFIVIYI